MVKTNGPQTRENEKTLISQGFFPVVGAVGVEPMSLLLLLKLSKERKAPRHV